jgi:hypothetical protein
MSDKTCSHPNIRREVIGYESFSAGSEPIYSPWFCKVCRSVLTDERASYLMALEVFVALYRAKNTISSPDD